MVESKNYRSRGLLLCVLMLLLGAASSAWCLSPDYDGTYAGSYAGDESGYWVAIIDTGAEDAVFLSYSPGTGEGDLGFFPDVDDLGGSASFRWFSTEIQSSDVNIVVTLADGSVAGTWDNAGSGESGTITGNKFTSVDHAGTYTGVFSGDDSGTWTITIDAAGDITGTMTSFDSGDSDIEGLCHPQGFVFIVGVDGDFAVFAELAGSSATGSWVADGGDSGTISPPAAGGGGSSSSSTCFIHSLTGE